jgi:hypothetical protein
VKVVRMGGFYNLSIKLFYSLRMLFIEFKFIKIYLCF